MEELWPEGGQMHLFCSKTPVSYSDTVGRPLRYFSSYRLRSCCWVKVMEGKYYNLCSLQSQVLDFGKIIIYTSNLRIIRAPPRNPEEPRHHADAHVDLEEYPKAKERTSRRRTKSPSSRVREDKDKGERQRSEMKTKVMVLIGSFLKFFTSPRVPFPFFPFPFKHMSLHCYFISAQLPGKWLLCNNMSVLTSVIIPVNHSHPQRADCSRTTVFTVFPCNFHLICPAIIFPFFFHGLILLQQPPSHCPCVIYQLWTYTDESTVFLCPCSICLPLISLRVLLLLCSPLPSWLILTPRDDYCPLSLAPFTFLSQGKMVIFFFCIINQRREYLPTFHKYYHCQYVWCFIFVVNTTFFNTKHWIHSNLVIITLHSITAQNRPKCMVLSAGYYCTTVSA